MGNVGTFILDLINAEGDPASEPSCTVDFLRLDNTDILRAPDLQFPPKHSFSLPAFPQERALHCLIAPSLYGIVQSSFFTLDDGSTREESAIVLRSPDKWTPKFATWTLLSAQFISLKSILQNQFLKLKHGPDIGVVTPSLYDAMSSPALQLAKMALLNLFSVLSAEKDPVSGQAWFSFIQHILVIDRERFVAVVTGDMYESIDHILNNLTTFKKNGFFLGEVALHLDNIPSEFQLTAPMISAKCRYEQGNVQFTMAKAQNANGNCILLDCDMDEHSNIIEHTGDLFKHVFTGGTHPIDIHEYIVHHQKGIDLGYTLSPNS